MAVAPVVGMLRRAVINDLTAGIGLGVSGGYLFWYTVHLPMMKKRDDYYLKLEQSKA